MTGAPLEAAHKLCQLTNSMIVTMTRASEREEQAVVRSQCRIKEPDTQTAARSRAGARPAPWLSMGRFSEESRHPTCCDSWEAASRFRGEQGCWTWWQLPAVEMLVFACWL